MTAQDQGPESTGKDEEAENTEGDDESTTDDSGRSRASTIVKIAAVVTLAGIAVTALSAVGLSFVLGLGDQVQATGQQSGQAVGAAVGGAQDANAFRHNIREGYVPQPTDVTHEGLYHDYYFETNQQRPCKERFCPSYSKATVRDPISGEMERFVAVGLNSGLSKAEVERKPLNLVVVLDTSGSMDSNFADYYYDGSEKRAVEDNQKKLAAATDAVLAMTRQLHARDRLAVVTYSDSASVVQELTRVEAIDRRRLRTRMHGLGANGGTNLDAGMTMARNVVANRPGDDEYETRIIYVTDAMPNTGDREEPSLENRVEAHADDGVHTTFVGVGVDFNSRLTENISTVEGANYYSVHSPDQFRSRMNETFSYMVTPLAYNLTLTVEAENYAIEKVYGSPQADETTGRLMRVATLFPSRTEGNRTEGGIVLVELNRTGPESTGDLTLTARYRDPETGNRHASKREISLEDREPPHYGSTGVRKGVLLTEYTNLVRNWAAYERARSGSETGPVVEEEGPIEHRELGEWEQRSVALQVSPRYRDRFEVFLSHFREEAATLGSDRFETDASILETLARHPGETDSRDRGDRGVAGPGTPSVTQTRTTTARTETSRLQLTANRTQSGNEPTTTAPAFGVVIGAVALRRELDG